MNYKETQGLRAIRVQESGQKFHLRVVESKKVYKRIRQVSLDEE